MTYLRLETELDKARNKGIWIGFWWGVVITTAVWVLGLLVWGLN